MADSKSSTNVARVVRVESNREDGETRWTVDARSSLGYSIVAISAELAESLKAGDAVKITVEIP